MTKLVMKPKTLPTRCMKDIGSRLECNLDAEHEGLCCAFIITRGEVGGAAINNIPEEFGTKSA